MSAANLGSSVQAKSDPLAITKRNKRGAYTTLSETGRNCRKPFHASCLLHISANQMIGSPCWQTTESEQLTAFRRKYCTPGDTLQDLGIKRLMSFIASHFGMVRNGAVMGNTLGWLSAGQFWPISSGPKRFRRQIARARVLPWFEPGPHFFSTTLQVRPKGKYTVNPRSV
jgi:hypothetical protein